VREIGVWKALGYTDQRCVRVIAYELALFAAIPTILGFALGVIGVVTVTSIDNGVLLGGAASLGWESFTSNAWPVLALFTPPVAVLLGGTWPLWRVLRLPPDIALRDLVHS
jgi:ABC-type lipoprotein release transport system permease subunit